MISDYFPSSGSGRTYGTTTIPAAAWRVRSPRRSYRFVVLGELCVRRAYVVGQLTGPKNGRGRFVAMSPGLGTMLIDLLAARRREAFERGWREISSWVFPSETGGLIDPKNCERSWRRLQRRAQREGVRPLKLHCTVTAQ